MNGRITILLIPFTLYFLYCLISYVIKYDDPELHYTIIDGKTVYLDCVYPMGIIVCRDNCLGFIPVSILYAFTLLTIYGIIGRFLFGMYFKSQNKVLLFIEDKFKINF